VDLPVVCVVDAILTSCNITGFWSSFDAVFVWACQNDSFPLARVSVGEQTFHNIFCYMCNPNTDTTGISTIDTCNVTGWWQDGDPNVAHACVNLPSHTSTYPYKNLFCFMCNEEDTMYELTTTVPHPVRPGTTERSATGVPTYRQLFAMPNMGHINSDPASNACIQDWTYDSFLVRAVFIIIAHARTLYT
jgi:hypothetical protein